MRILFVTLAVPAHVHLMVPLAWAFRAAGHDVRVAAAPQVLGTITQAGLHAVVVGRSYDFMAGAVAFLRANPGLRRPTSEAANPVAGAPRPAGNPWIAAAEASAAELVEFGQWWRPDLVVTDPMCYAGPLVAQVLDVPLVRQLWGPDWTKSGFGMGGSAEGAPASASWPPELVALYESYGARTGIDFASYSVDPFPPSLRIPGLANRLPMRHVPYHGAGVVPEWLAHPQVRPRVCLTWGTSTTVFLGPDAFLVPRLLAGLSGLGVEVVLAVSRSDLKLLDSVPAEVRVVEEVPLDLLLPTCAAVVNQGGAAVVAGAAAHAVPQVIIPQLADQPVNARLLAATGAGIELDAASIDDATVGAAVREVVSGAAARAAALRLREEIRAQPAPAEIVATLEDLAREKGL